MKASGASAMLSGMNRMKKTQTTLRFGIVTDLHYADTEPRGRRNFRESATKLTECIDFMTRQTVAFLVELGDFKDEGVPAAEAESLEYLKRIEAVFAGFNGPRYHVLGNHDLDCLSKEQFQSQTENTGISKDRTFYSFEAHGVHFIVLDANFTADGTAYGHNNFDWTDTWIPPAELEWLQADLAQTGRPVLVFSHQLLDGDDDYCVKNAAEVRRILENHGHVRAVFQGHKHDGGYNRINGIHYYTLKAVVEGSGPGNNAYAIVAISEDHTITISGHRRAQTLQLA